MLALTIAGFDPTAGAGATADLKTFAAHSVYGMAALTALTVQSTQGVFAVEPVDAALLRSTLQRLSQDVHFDGVKIGMLGTAAVVEEVCDFLEYSRPAWVVLDPIIRSSSGAALIDDSGLQLMQNRLLALVHWVTPNLAELAGLLGRPVATDRKGVEEQAEELTTIHSACNLVVTGGHFESPDDYVLLADQPGGPAANSGQRSEWLGGVRVQTSSTHGTGCAFSSALLCALLAGKVGVEAVDEAKQFVAGALAAAPQIGRGHGPMQHFWRC